MHIKKKRIGDMVLEAGIANDFQIAVAVGRSKTWGTKVGEELVRLGFVTEEDLAGMLEKQLGIKWFKLKDIQIDSNIIDMINKEHVLKYKVIPICGDPRTLTIATSDPMDFKMISTLEFALHKRIVTVIATPTDIRSVISRYYDDVCFAEDQLMESSFGDSSMEDMIPDVMRGTYIMTAIEIIVDTLVNHDLTKKDKFFLELDRRVARKAKNNEVADGSGL